jgi:hypothetical protein
MSGGKNYAKRYAQYKPDATNFGEYVDSRTDLKDAWQRIQDDPDHADSQYWIKRGATSKEAFGRAHAAEDSALLGGTYMGATDYDVGTEAWEGLFDDGKTSYQQFLAGGGNGGAGDNLIGGTTGGVTSDIIAQDAYSAPAYQDFSEYSSLLDGNEGLLYQPHTAEYQSKFGTDMYNYNPVELDPWTARTVDWSPSLLDASDYLTNEEKAAKIKAAGTRDGRDPYDPMSDPANYMPGHELDAAYYTGPDTTWAGVPRVHFNWGTKLGSLGNKFLGLQDPTDILAAINALDAPPAVDFGIGTNAGVDIGELEIMTPDEESDTSSISQSL